jgi:hypothetical protein
MRRMQNLALSERYTTPEKVALMEASGAAGG